MQIITTGCLFDMGIHKPDIAKFFRNPHLSENVKNTLSANGIINNNDFLIILERAIKKLEIGSFYKIKDWVKENPIKGLIFTFLISFIFSGEYSGQTEPLNPGQTEPVIPGQTEPLIPVKLSHLRV
jgi:hypothetical protein